MQREPSADKGALFWVGLIYSLLGGIFTVMGTVLAIAPDEQEAAMVGIIFAGIGSLFLILGIVFLVVTLKKRQTARKLLEEGKYILGEIVEWMPNDRVRVNGRNPYIARVRYVDGNGTIHIFKSGNLYRYPDPSMLHQQVKIYIEDNKFKKYFVDIQEIMPKVEEH